jgi:uncharacterized integral membrane protein
MRRLIFALVMAVIFFAMLNFIYCNLGTEAFGSSVVFKFSIPYLLMLQSEPLPLGFVLLAAFVAGMVAIAVLEAIPSFFKALELRSRNRRIRQLERELETARRLSRESSSKILDLPTFDDEVGEK